MPNYFFAYHKGPDFDKQEHGPEHMQKWGAWLQGLGDAVVNPNSPFKSSMMVSSAGVSSEGTTKSMMGFSIIKAANMDAATKIAQDCPFLAMGNIEVSEMIDM